MGNDVGLYNDPDNVKARDLTIEGLVRYETPTGEAKEYEEVSFTTWVKDPEDFQTMLSSLKSLVPVEHRRWNPGLKRWTITPLIPKYERYLYQIFPNFNGAITGARSQQMFPGWDRKHRQDFKL